MRVTGRLLVAVLCLAGGTAAVAQPDHVMVTPDTIEWKEGPAALPPGTKSALLYGDPSKPELFVLRIWFPKGFRVAAHTHPLPEVVTVISGTVSLSYGSAAGQTNRLTAGSFMVTPPNTAHYAVFEEDTVLQLSTTGPWALSYVDAADDPRKNGQ